MLARASRAFTARVLRRFDAQVAAADPPVERLYGPPLAAVAYRNHALQSRVPTTYGYNPLELAAYAAYTEAAATANLRLISGLAANYQLSGGQLAPLDGALPMAYFAHSVLFVADQSAAVQGLTNLEPATTTLVEGAQPRVEADPSARVSVLLSEPKAVTLRYASVTPNLLRVAIPIYPGWQATLGDGQELSLVTVDAAFIGVLVPAGGRNPPRLHAALVLAWRTAQRPGAPGRHARLPHDKTSVTHWVKAQPVTATSRRMRLLRALCSTSASPSASSTGGT